MTTRAFSPTPTTLAAVLLPALDVAAESGLVISVVPVGITSETANATRAMDRDEIEIHVGIQKKLVGEVGAELTEVNTLLGLVGDVKKFLSRLSPLANVQWKSTEVSPLWLPEHLQKRVFTSVLRVNYVTYTAAGG